MQLKNISFSSLLCVYGKDDPSLLNFAFQSIFDQTLLPSELVIVVDGPIPQALTDEIVQSEKLCLSLSIISSVIWLPSNVGHGVARNTGIESCCNEIVVLCDADDYNLPNRFNILVGAMSADTSLSVVGSTVVEVAKTSGEKLGIRDVKCQHHEIITDMSYRCPFNQMTVALRKDHVLSVGGYRPIHNNEDYDLWISWHRLTASSKTFRNL